ncbi:MAG: SH3 domain-containing protein [Lachnospiraceae bacterium]|nr:SH3 domain-containing protein [Lachnospiraceae bacterium]
MKRRRGRDDFDIRDFLMTHYQYLIVGGLFIILVVVLAIFSAKHKGDKKDEEATEVTETTTETTYDENAEIPLPQEELKVDAYPEVNALVSSYFTAMATGDVATLSTICSDLDDAAKIRIQEKANYTESYDDLKCYTKPGPIPNSYIVFAYYQIKYVNIDTKAPGLSSLYVCTDENTGSLYVYNGDLSENVSNYIKGVAAQEDVVALLSQVDTEYNNAVESDKTLKAFMDALPARLDEAVAARLASGATVDEAGAVSENTTQEVTVKLTDSVRIRSSASKDDESNVIAKAAAGDTYTKIGEEGEWTKIRYKDTEAYVSSEYCEVVDTPVDGAAPADATTGEATAETTNDGGGAQAASGSITVNDSDVRVRSSADTNSNDNIIGKANSGETYTLTGEVDGWYQIDFKGQTGYIKGDYASKN